MTLCEVLAARGEALTVFLDEQRQHVLDLRAILNRVPGSLGQIYKWETLNTVSGFKERQTLPCLLDQNEAYPVETDVAASQSFGSCSVEPSSSSSAIVPAPRDVSGSVVALSRLWREAGKEVAPAPVLLANIPSVDYTQLRELHHQGVVALSETEFGEQTATINPNAVVWTCVYLIGNARPMVVWTSAVVDSSKLSKVELMVRLRRRGWVDADVVPAAWKEGDALVMQCNLSRPCSYFRALYERGHLVSKGVDAITHRGKDAFYLGLLKLKGDELQAFLALAAQGDEEGAALLAIENGAACSQESDADEAAIAAGPVVDLPAVLDMPHALPDEVPSSVWKRFMVTDGFNPSLKIYFDGGTDGSGLVRCFNEPCPAHDCRRYKYTDNYVDRHSLAADYYLWFLAAGLPECCDKERRLAYSPPEFELDVVRDLSLTEF